MVERILVVGAGAMGSQIGMVAALAGIDTTVQDVSAEQLPRAEAQLRDRLAGQVAKGRRTQEDVDAAFARLRFTTELETAAAAADYVIEAAIERIDIKRELFARLGAAAPAHAILATNSSTIPSSELADASGRADRVCNLHFFMPPLVMRAVEVVRGPETSDATVATTTALAERLGKTPVVLNREIPGFVANRLLWAIREEALRMYGDGIASYQDIDAAAREALGHPMGPFELMDLVGNDVAYRNKIAVYEQTGDEAELPHPALVALYEKGDYGRKTGKGWYDYDSR
ncbi:3-hydroxyacyl-CoA dehydrogenase family protein [Microbacterium sp. ASV49]|uniref:3-hydroxyacyl-CoA dehydrogenase family protein n=1 Tax=Microbacterium candidum TaxID=3041922 RepID=A0ABT7MW56_9MICO|nr:3-hydroxyacyl-CoA dehydrogenase family protein [Microbacterium sp. ASV49]MDL9978680.1 3-hydroxyacyl-CoA dehydrogenase family protein [Microbacterium sp. ASV49]